MTMRQVAVIPAASCCRASLVIVFLATPLAPRNAAFGLDPWQIAVGYDQLLNALGADVPNGEGLSVSLVESADGVGAYFPDASLPDFTAGTDPLGQPVQFIDGSSGQNLGISTHATGMARFFFGNDLGLAKAANKVTVYQVDRWLENIVKYNSSSPPATQNFKVQNHSWVGTINPGNPIEDNPVLQRVDYIIENRNLVMSVGTNNYSPTTSGQPALLASSFNAIVAGRSDSLHGRGPTTSPYHSGRYKPDIVSAAGSTSQATAQVSSAATILIDAAAGTLATHNEVIKAMLMAGATKQEFADFQDPVTGVAAPWDHTPTRPLDDIFGAGELNVFNSYKIRIGGRKQAVQAAPSSAAGSYGWDYQDLRGNTTVGDLYYNLVVPAGSSATELSVILAWNAKVEDLNTEAGTFVPSESLQNLDLRIYNSTGGFLASLLDESVSTVDNVEHIYRTALAPGTYTLAVSGAADWDYGIAWRMQTLFDVPSADFYNNNLVDGRDLLSLQRNMGKLIGATFGQGDANGDGAVDAADMAIFKQQFGGPPPTAAVGNLAIHPVPEPSGLVAALTACGLSWAARRRGRKTSAPISPSKRRRQRQPRRTAFSLVELLVVIAIIGSLIALLLPAVQAAREASRRVQCASGIRQVALATLNYEQDKRALPSAGDFPPAEDIAFYSYYYWRIDLHQGFNHSWLTKLLPYLEQSALYQQFDFKSHISTNPQHPEAQQPEMLLCPSDAPFGRMFNHVDGSSGIERPFGKANIAAFSNPYHTDWIDVCGAISLYGTELRQVTDGTSNTLLLGEIRTRDDQRDQRGAWALPWSATSLLAVDMHPSEDRGQNNSQPPPYLYNPLSLGYTQVPNSKHPDVLYECPDLVGEQVEAMPCTDQYWGYISAAPRSLHPSGVNVAMLDGSTRFLTNDCDEIAMAYAASIDDDQSHEGL